MLGLGAAFGLRLTAPAARRETFGDISSGRYQVRRRVIRTEGARQRRGTRASSVGSRVGEHDGIPKQNAGEQIRCNSVYRPGLRTFAPVRRRTKCPQWSASNRVLTLV